jgi:hypothetical protein
MGHVIAQVRFRTHSYRDAVDAHEPAKVLSDMMRDYQPIWRIRSRMSPL